MKTFSQFIDKKTREAKHQLNILKKVLEHNKLDVRDFLSDPEPYLYLSNSKNTSFDGVRIYKIGSNIAFRIQNEEKSHPYGRAYLLDIEEMFSDLVSDMNDKKAGEEVMKSIVKEFTSFFDKSSEAEDEIRSSEIIDSNDKAGKVLIAGQGTDYANLISNPKTSSPF